MVQLDPEIAKQIVSEIQVPPRPEALVKITQEINSDNPNMQSISNFISKDVSLAGSILQVVNSAAYGLQRKITDVQHAAALLGLEKINKLVNVITLRNQMQGEIKLDRFWDSATEIANLAGRLAKQLSGVSSDDAYTFGLFHDCGIPLMMQRFEDYKDILRIINTSGILPKTKLEDQKYGINHCMVGYHLCNRWNLPDIICNGIFLHHHSLDKLSTGEEHADTVVLIAILKAAEQISHEYRSAWRIDENKEWEQIEEQVTTTLGLTYDDFVDLQDSMIDWLEKEKNS